MVSLCSREEKAVSIPGLHVEFAAHEPECLDSRNAVVLELLLHLCARARELGMQVLIHERDASLGFTLWSHTRGLRYKRLQE